MADGEQVGSVFWTIGADGSGFQNALMGASNMAAQFGRLLGQISPVAMFADAVKAAAGLQDATAQMNSVLKSTGDASGQSAEGLRAFAEQASQVSKFSAESVMSAQDILLTFKDISGETFPQATQATMDLATAMHMDLNSAALQLGKALGEPTKGLTSLVREGVTFSDSQKEMIKHFAAIGDVADADKIILGELSTEFGGSATAAGQTFNGQLAILGNTFQNLMTTIGTQFLPTLTGLVSGITGFVNDLAQSDPQTLQFIATVVALSAALIVLPGIIGAIGGALAVITGPVGLVIGAAVALAAAWQTNFGGIRDTVNTVWGEIKPIFDAITGAMQSIFAGPQSQSQTITFGNQGQKGGKQLGDDQDSSGSRTQQVQIDQFQKLKDALGPLAPVLDTAKGAFDKIGGAISDFFKVVGSADWSGVKTIVSDLAQALGAFITLSLAIGTGLLSGIVNSLSDIGTFIHSIINAISDLVSDSPQKFFQDIMTAVGSVAKVFVNLVKAVSDTVGAVLGIKDPFEQVFGEGGIASQALAVFKAVWDKLFGPTGIFSHVAADISGWLAGVGAAFQPLVSAIQGVLDVANNAINAIKTLLGLQTNSSAPNASANNLPAGSPKAGRFGANATGGQFSAGQPFLAGEFGPELIVPGATSGSVITNQALRSGGGGGTSITLNNPTFQGVQNVSDLLDQLQKAAGRRNLSLVSPVGS